MRFRTVAASAVLVLSATTATAACSSTEATDNAQPAGPAASSSPVSVEGVGGKVEKGKHQEGGPQIGKPGGVDPADCATSAAQIPPECEVPGLSPTEVEEGQPAPETPSTP